ncbi:acetyltransferase, GNAT family protein [Formosa agariphila KMM 3901]|uniref:Acetyltransferase, GNAT family protein n=1 Tax=Formosa agariphila (strain DSM 15362 / KCTC 12365 / LMG 23005 / KMM 3901 / M-2Alg 35-1) TaxID=1347342 RepID=T2KP35_FORAG|nr:GNAT family N-acetyltransferase [Formosa agariphila]CDF80510.1 acetyltransferase, GNAT family protein [Formosa agariphila KMM 3901]
MQKFTQNKHSDALLFERFSEMFGQNYECIGVFNDETLIGICGLWFCTRHYSGRSIEVDHVYIDDEYQSKGIGKQLFSWIYTYAKAKGYEAVELNTYVQNHPSHKFYYNEGFNILGYHFVKKM